MVRKPKHNLFESEEIEKLLSFGYLGSKELQALRKRFKEIRRRIHQLHLKGRERVLEVYIELVRDRIVLLVERLEPRGVVLPEFQDLLQAAYAALIQAVNECYPLKRNQLGARAVTYIAREVGYLLNQSGQLPDRPTNKDIQPDVAEQVCVHDLCNKLLSIVGERERLIVFAICAEDASLRELSTEIGLTAPGIAYRRDTSLCRIRQIAKKRHLV